MRKCYRCKGTGELPDLIKSGVPAYICKICGFEALGKTQVRQFEKRDGYCRECSGDYISR